MGIEAANLQLLDVVDVLLLLFVFKKVGPNQWDSFEPQSFYRKSPGSFGLERSLQGRILAPMRSSVMMAMLMALKPCLNSRLVTTSREILLV